MNWYAYNTSSLRANLVYTSAFNDITVNCPPQVSQNPKRNLLRLKKYLILERTRELECRKAIYTFYDLKWPSIDILSDYLAVKLLTNDSLCIIKDPFRVSRCLFTLC